jgi:hypothetical protein
LRSFKDEQASVRPTSVLKSIVGLRFRLEEVVAANVKAFGPPVAIGLPKETIPPLGALREYYSDDDWRGAVTDWCARAEEIVVIAGTSPGSIWELRHIFENDLTNRLVVVFPPDLGHATKATRLAILAEVADGTVWGQEIRSVTPRDVLLVRLRQGGGLFVVHGSDRIQATYDLALKAAFVDKESDGLGVPRR